MPPHSLAVRLDDDQYLPPVDPARLDVRWFDGDDYTVHYVETRSGGVWQCCWIRRPKPGESCAQFHPPPDASDTVEASPLSGTHYLGVCFDILDRVVDRLERPHEQ